MDQLHLNILGVEYVVHVLTAEQDSNLDECAGYCDHTTHRIVIEDQGLKQDGFCDWLEIQKRILRHEIIHAFLFESGLGADASYIAEGETHPELMVDWFARQAPKIYAVYKTAGII